MISYALRLIGKFRIPRRPWDEHDCEANGRVNFFAKTKSNIRDLPLGRWKTIENLKIIWFQSLNFTSKRKGHLLQTTTLWWKLIVLNRRSATKPKEEVNFLSFKRVKFVKMTIFLFPLIILSYSTSTPHRPYIDPSSTLHRAHIDPTSTLHRPLIDPTSTLHSTFFSF